MGMNQNERSQNLYVFYSSPLQTKLMHMNDLIQNLRITLMAIINRQEFFLMSMILATFIMGIICCCLVFSGHH